MSLKKWKDNATHLAESHERLITVMLVVVALILLYVALFGKAHHKAMAIVYIIL